MGDNLATKPCIHVRADSPIDQPVALKTAATGLQSEFAGVFGVQTIERLLHSSYEQFADRQLHAPLNA